MNRINLMDVIFVCKRGLREPAGYLFLLASTTWFLVLTSKMTLRTSFTSLNDSGIASDFALLSLTGGLRIVVCYMSFE
jgi:hypothetical protein